MMSSTMIAFKDFEIQDTGFLGMTSGSLEVAVDLANKWIAQNGPSIVNVETLTHTSSGGGITTRVELGLRVWFYQK